MRGSPTIPALVAALVLHSGCQQVTAGADKIWPALIVVSGVASVPASFTVAGLELRPARSLTVRLVPRGGQPWAAVGVGRVTGTEGRYTISVPENDLEPAARAFEAQALEPGGRIVVASPVALSRSNGRVERNLDPGTTIVALAARRAGPGRPVAAWNVDSLASLPAVKAAAERLASAPAAIGPLAAMGSAASTAVTRETPALASTLPDIATPFAPGILPPSIAASSASEATPPAVGATATSAPGAPTSPPAGAPERIEIRNFALLPASGLPPEVDRAVAAVLAAAP